MRNKAKNRLPPRKIINAEIERLLIDNASDGIEVQDIWRILREQKIMVTRSIIYDHINRLYRDGWHFGVSCGSIKILAIETKEREHDASVQDTED